MVKEGKTPAGKDQSVLGGGGRGCLLALHDFYPKLVVGVVATAECMSSPFSLGNTL